MNRGSGAFTRISSKMRCATVQRARRSRSAWQPTEIICERMWMTKGPDCRRANPRLVCSGFLPRARKAAARPAWDFIFARSLSNAGAVRSAAKIGRDAERDSGFGFREAEGQGGRPHRATGPPAEDTSAREANAGKSVTPLRLLLADDSPVNLRVTSLLLENRGHEVTAVENGKEVLARMKKERFDAVILDEEMPQMGGLEAVRAIRKMEASNGEAHSRGTGHRKRLGSRPPAIARSGRGCAHRQAVSGRGIVSRGRRFVRCRWPRRVRAAEELRPPQKRSTRRSS